MDTFFSMGELLSTLSPRDNYEIRVDRSHQSSIKIFAPHGGCIEPCTEPVAVAIAMDMLDYYVFSGKRKTGCFKTLHVTSTHYDEPQCLQMAQEAELAVALHGCEGEESFIHVGGGNRDFALSLIEYLMDLGYKTAEGFGNLSGEDDRNFVNRSRKKGLQLELSVGFRRSLFPAFPKSHQRHPAEFPKIVNAMRGWLSEAARSLTQVSGC